jgi:inorganic pyrophosphatase
MRTSRGGLGGRLPIPDAGTGLAYGYCKTSKDDDLKEVRGLCHGVQEPGRYGALGTEEEAWSVIIETVQGSRNKLKYEPASGTFVLCKVLPLGMAFPFDFGFLPSTQGEDGDPLDVLVLLDEPAFAGCRILCHMIGVIEAEQTEDGECQQNDRLLAVARESHIHKGIQSLKDLPANLLAEIEHFFVHSPGRPSR